MAVANETGVGQHTSAVGNIAVPDGAAMPVAIGAQFTRVDPRFPSGTITVQARYKTIVRFAPDSRADKLGVLPRTSRVKFRGAAEGRGCPGGLWIEVEPSGWACSRTLKPSDQPMTRKEYPRRFPGKNRVPKNARVKAGTDVRLYRTRADAEAGANGRRAGFMMDVERRRSLTINERKFWLTTEGDYVAEDDLYMIRGAWFEGVPLDKDFNLPMGWAVHRNSLSRKVRVRSAPKLKSKIVRRLRPRSIVKVLEETKSGWVRIGEDEWLHPRSVRVARRFARPDRVKSDAETWVDVDLRSHTLVVYKGLQATYATLFTSGKWKTPTPKGVFRITKKTASATMASPKWYEPAYSLGGVPYVMHFKKLYALHGAYWHNLFGIRFSHGCVNLSPADARTIYSLVGPTVPDGWYQIFSNADNLGSVVQIRRGNKITRRRSRQASRTR